MGLPKDEMKALLCWIRAGEQGQGESFSLVAQAFGDGREVEQDMKKEVHFHKRAAMLGHPILRHNLGTMEWRAGNPTLQDCS